MSHLVLRPPTLRSSAFVLPFAGEADLPGERRLLRDLEFLRPRRISRRRVREPTSGGKFAFEPLPVACPVERLGTLCLRSQREFQPDLIEAEPVLLVLRPLCMPRLLSTLLLLLLLLQLLLLLLHNASDRKRPCSL